jgi:Cu(I)/Ag(I) efflux system protein CusF
MPFRPLLVAALLASLAAPGLACESGPGHTHAKPVKLVPGEVLAVDRAQGTVTLTQPAIEQAGIPESTLVYRAARPAQVKALKAGDKVRFRAEEVAGTLTVMEIRKAPRR